LASITVGAIAKSIGVALKLTGYGWTRSSSASSRGFRLQRFLRA
jgi:hypothetical protein